MPSPVLRARTRLARLLTLVAALLAPGLALAADVINPAAVEGLFVEKSGADVRLTWTDVATDAAGNAETISFYRVFRGTDPAFVPDKQAGSNEIGTSASASFLDAGAAVDGITYFYRVSAVDAAGNESATKPPRATTPPTLTGAWTDTSIDLDWTGAAPVDEITGYRVYYGKRSGQYEFVDDVGLTNAHSLTGLELWVNWYVAVTAVDVHGNESAFSNQHIDAIAGRVRVMAHDEDRLCWGASKCTPADPRKVQRSDGWELLVPTAFPEGEWKRVLVRFTLDSRLCEPPAGQNVTRCGSGNPCLYPPCNGGYNTCGDPWDRTAYLYLVLDDCVAQGGSCRTNNNLELIHAVTPFGTDAPPPNGTGIVPPRVLTFDVTPYAPLLAGERHVGAFIGHFVQAGWYVTVQFEFSKRPDEASPKPPADGIQVLFYGNQSPPTATVSIPANATQVFTRLFTTGHGGSPFCNGGTRNGLSCDGGCPGGSCQNCDEFCQRTNQILVDDAVVWSAVPWRTDCAFEPGTGQFCLGGWNSCGTCAYSRAGWCPGYIACHTNAPCDNDLDMTPHLAPGGTYQVDYNVTPLNGSWDVSLVAYWYED